MPSKIKPVKRLRKLGKLLGDVRLEDMRDHPVWAIDETRKKEVGCWVCPITYAPPLDRFMCDFYAPLIVKAVFEFADGTYPRGVMSPSQEALPTDFDLGVFGVAGSLVEFSVSEFDSGCVSRICAGLGRTIEQIFPLRFAAVVECGRKVVSSGTLHGFPMARRDRSRVLWMQDGIEYVTKDPEAP
ncbi:MAG: hypothetical protein R3B68_08250 [Phycisphaerales bacterium]